MVNVNLGVPDENWDDVIARLNGHFFQTRTWAIFQKRLGRKVLSAASQDWAWLATDRVGRGKIKYLYAPYGPVVRSGALAEAIRSLQSAAIDERSMFLKIEPMGEVDSSQLQKLGLEVVDEFQPQYMLELDLMPTEDELKQAVSPSNRNLINQAFNRGLSFRVSQNPADVETFNQIHNATAVHAGIKTHGDEYYKTLVEVLIEEKRGGLYFVDYDGDAVAAALCFDWNGTRYYAFAGADPVKNREFKAAVALLWWLITDAKAKGLKRFNYGGVAPENQPNHPWAGHSRFKRSIGGQTIMTAGTWDLPLKSAQYRAYQLAKRVLPL